MSFLTIYLIAAIAAAIVLGFNVWYDYSHPAGHMEPQPITLGDLFLGSVVCMCPIVNILVVVVCVWYFFDMVAPRIVVFGGKRD